MVSTDHITTNIITQGISLLPATQGLITSKFGVWSDEKLRGGRGAWHRRRGAVPHHRIYKTPLIRDNDIVVFGSAESFYIPAKYKFFKSLPTIAKDNATNPTAYSYTSDGDIQISGETVTQHIDFSSKIPFLDDDFIISDLLDTNDNMFNGPFFEWYDDLIDDDAELLEITELL